MNLSIYFNIYFRPEARCNNGIIMILKMFVFLKEKYIKKMFSDYSNII